MTNSKIYKDLVTKACATQPAFRVRAEEYQNGLNNGLNQCEPVAVQSLAIGDSCPEGLSPAASAGGATLCMATASPLLDMTCFTYIHSTFIYMGALGDYSSDPICDF